MEEHLARIDANLFLLIWTKAKKEHPQISRKTIYARIRAVRKEFGNAISPRMAANVLASRMGIDVYKIIKNRSELEELRNLRSRSLLQDLLKETVPRIVPRKKKVVRPKKPSKKVFIVHGRDDKPVKELKLMLSNLGLKPIILHEQPSGSRTIVEKLEKYSDVGYAFVILTPDDLGAEKLDFWEKFLSAVNKLRDIIEVELALPNKARLKTILDELTSTSEFLNHRARQNVVLEFGYFMGLLNRDRVCCLYTGDVELPSDMSGIVYAAFGDSVSELKEKIAKELKAVNYDLKAVTAK